MFVLWCFNQGCIETGWSCYYVHILPLLQFPLYHSNLIPVPKLQVQEFALLLSTSLALTFKKSMYGFKIPKDILFCYALFFDTIATIFRYSGTPTISPPGGEYFYTSRTSRVVKVEKVGGGFPKRPQICYPHTPQKQSRGVRGYRGGINQYSV
jgi:hypothetical protein